MAGINGTASDLVRKEPDMFTFRELHEVRDLYPLVDLQQIIWDMSAAECVSPHTMRATTVNGGVVIGAYDAARVVGFCFGFPSRRGDQVMLWSYITGVHPDYQDQGVGYQLKVEQRRWAKANGYDVIGWTYDPMQRRNANFNFNRLGVRVRRYYVDFYGEMADGLNAGLASDRFEAEWTVGGEPTPPSAGTAGTAGAAGAAGKADIPFLLREQDGRIVVDGVSLDAAMCAVEIPFDLKALKRDHIEHAVEWQLAVRDGVQQALAAGFVVAGFVIQAPRCWYVLNR
jgi:predicted GNAT superfamily acetyltransferase